MTPTEPSSGKAANVPTHYETLRGLQKKLAGLKNEAKFYGSPFPDSKRQAAEAAYASYEALTALLAERDALRDKISQLLGWAKDADDCPTWVIRMLQSILNATPAGEDLRVSEGEQ